RPVGRRPRSRRRPPEKTESKVGAWFALSVWGSRRQAADRGGTSVLRDANVPETGTPGMPGAPGMQYSNREPVAARTRPSTRRFTDRQSGAITESDFMHTAIFPSPTRRGMTAAGRAMLLASAPVLAQGQQAVQSAQASSPQPPRPMVAPPPRPAMPQAG